MADEDPGTRWRLQPRAVAPPCLGRGHRADAARQRLVRQPRHLLVELARAGQGRVRVRVARHDPRQAPRRRHRRRPRDRHRHPAAVALGRPPRDPARRRRRPHALAGQPPDLVPDVTRLPRVRRGPDPAAGHALPRAPGPRDVARLQRVRVPQPALLLRRVRAALPRLAAAPLRDPRDVSTTRGAPPSGASATPTGSRSCRRAGRRRSTTRPTCSTTSASAPTRCSTTCGPSAPSSTSSPPACP